MRIALILFFFFFFEFEGEFVFVVVVVVAVFLLTTYFEGGFKLQQNWLVEEDFTRFQTKTSYFTLCELYIFSRSRSTN